MAKVSAFGKPDSLVAGEVLVPLVVLKNGQQFIGFIPGFVMKNIVENSPETCFAKLKTYLKDRLKVMIENNLEFPFFPTRQQIMSDFENVYSVEFIKIKSSARKS